MAYQATAVRAKTIVNNTFRTDRRNAEFVRPAGLKIQSWGYEMRTITKKPKEAIRRYVVSVRLPTDYVGHLSRCKDVKVDCTCSRYMFVWNYALNKAGAAIVDRTNGEPPVVTNPNLKPGICKHGLIALQFLLKADPHWPSSGARRPAGSDPNSKKRRVSLKTVKL